MSVQSQVSSNASKANGVTTVFPYAFKIIQATDLLVTVDGVVKVLNVDYTLTGVGIDGGGNVTFAVAPADQALVVRKRAMAYERITDYQQLGDLQSPTLNNDQDAPVLMIQQLAASDALSLKVPDASPPISGLLPPPDANGSPIGYNLDGDGFRLVDLTGPGDLLLRSDLADPAGGAALVAFLQSGTGAVLRTVLSKLRERYTPEDAGCVGDGITDDTVNFQKAVTYCISTGRRLSLPAKTYRLTAPILCPDRLEMVGEGSTPYNGTVTNNHNNRGGGSWLYFDHAGKGINLDRVTGETTGILLADFGTFRNHADPGVGWAPTVADYDISHQQTAGGDATFRNIMLWNAFNGIISTGRTTFQSIRGQAFANFLSAPFNADTTRFNDCHYFPFWSTNANVVAYTLANATAYRLARVDNPVMTGCFCLYANAGVAIVNDGSGTVSKLLLSNCDFDACQYGFRILATGATVFMTNFQSQAQTGIANTIGFWITGNDNIVKMNGVSLGYQSSTAFRIDGTGNYVTVGNAEVYEYDNAAVGTAAIEVAVGNELYFSEKPRVTRSAGAGTIFAGAGTIKSPLSYGRFSGTTSAGGDVTVAHGAGVIPRCILLTLRAPDLAYILRTDTENATNFVVRVRTDTGAVLNAGSVVFDWEAKF